MPALRHGPKHQDALRTTCILRQSPRLQSRSWAHSRFAAPWPHLALVHLHKEVDADLHQRLDHELQRARLAGSGLQRPNPPALSRTFTPTLIQSLGHKPIFRCENATAQLQGAPGDDLRLEVAVCGRRRHPAAVFASSPESVLLDPVGIFREKFRAVKFWSRLKWIESRF